MTKFNLEEDLLGGEEIRITRKGLLPKWFRIFLLMLVIYMAWVMLKTMYAVFNGYLTAILSNLPLTISWIVQIILQVLEIWACIALLREKKYAVKLVFIIGVSAVILRALIIWSNYNLIKRLDLNTADFIRVIWPIALRIAVFVVVFFMAWKVRKQWRDAVPSYVKS